MMMSFQLIIVWERQKVKGNLHFVVGQNVVGKAWRRLEQPQNENDTLQTNGNVYYLILNNFLYSRCSQETKAEKSCTFLNLPDVLTTTFNVCGKDGRKKRTVISGQTKLRIYNVRVN